MEQLAVSVVVPIYNVEPYLTECLNSLERQTLKNIEVLMVNDGSTDNSPIIAEQYAKRNTNFHLIHRENGGLSAARNTGMKHASGKYIYFLDSDDYILDDALNILYSTAESKKLDVLHFVSDILIESNEPSVWKRQNGARYNGAYPNIYKGTDILKEFSDNSDFAFPSCCLIFSRLEFIKEQNLEFLEGVIHEDTLFHMQLVSLAGRTAVINMPLYLCRVRKGSITRSINYEKLLFSAYDLAYTADLFYIENPTIPSSYFYWYIKYYFFKFLDSWKNSNLTDRSSDSYRLKYKSIRNLIWKYNYCNDKRLFLFSISDSLYLLCDKVYGILKSKRCGNE